jgi:asparagine synthase (glutamine-hydrolysing)
MCGFLGIINSSNVINLRIPWNAISWRGTVHGGWNAENCTILASRLPRSGDRKRPQPILVNYRSVFSLNGEIYNIKDLKRFVSKANLNFAADLSDAETLGLILEYCENKHDVITELRGEYALSFYDKEKRELTLARDLMGTKPLFWTKIHRAIAFGSSAKAVALIEKNSLKPDWSKIQNILEFGVTPSANIFQEVESIYPGEIKTFKFSNKSTTSFSVIKNPTTGQSIICDLEEAVNCRTNSKTALAFSGGVDSSLIKLLSPNIPCYTILLREESLSSKQTGVIVNESSLLKNLIQMWSLIDRPFSTLSPVAMSVLATEMKKDGIENMLSGEGADELFSGYPYLYKNTNGHPILNRHKVNFDLACKILKIHLGNKPTYFSSFLESESSTDWLHFDRWVRLPQHLTLLHTDCPSLINGIEARLPFLDMVKHGILDPNKLTTPKQPLKDILENYSIDPYQPTPIKQGLFVPCGIFCDNLLLELCEQNFDNLQPYIPINFKTVCENALNNIAILPDSIKNDWRELIARTIIQICALPHILSIPKQELKTPCSFVSLGKDYNPTICNLAS